MPTYQYACTQCGHRFEQFQAFSDAALTECPVCGGKLRKVYGSVGVVFKGSGFYRTDARAGDGKKDGAAKSDGAAPAAAKSDSTASSTGSSSSSSSGEGTSGSSAKTPKSAGSASSSGSSTGASKAAGS
ncbi:FmdB family zinc ribbon protein [Nakamurella endophytica]|uniref:Putative regulatory protein FmdB zinc ribbon domain-containing protein n=1 Tax=Nakamurella endophytica TaxID=1748367 RepID=A0A917SNZ3_9ACTN|nr:FmdB family zinc ribbon protein [Nakamurella endophytica]GGL88194.1 hypothetical protein GCM10011594_04760 [Nakamurella endophytica]